MKKLICILICFTFLISLLPVSSSADVGSIAMTQELFSALVIPTMDALGINFSFTNFNQSQLTSFITGFVSRFFGVYDFSNLGSVVINGAKLILNSDTANHIRSFISDFTTNNSLSNGQSKNLTQALYGYWNNHPVINSYYFNQLSNAEKINLINNFGSNVGTVNTGYPCIYYDSSSAYSPLNVVYKNGSVGSTGGSRPLKYCLAISANGYEILYAISYSDNTYSFTGGDNSNLFTIDTISANVTLSSDYDNFTELSSNENLELNLGVTGVTSASDIYQGIISNSYTPTYEIVADVPVTTPAPTTIPLDTIPTPVPLEPTDATDINGLGESISEWIGALEQTITNAFSWSNGSTTSAIQEQTESISVTPSEDDSNDYKFTLTNLFPFCIPFDIYNIFTSFSQTAAAPSMSIPIVVQRLGINYTLNLDLSSFNTVAQICRTLEFIAFCVGLAILTGKVIKW